MSHPPPAEALAVRAATEADGATLAEILVEALLDCHTPIIPESVERSFVASYSHDLVGRAWQHMLLAEERARAIAMLYRDGGRIEALNARPGHRGRGAGRALMAAAEAAMREERRLAVEVDTYEANRDARSFYGELGFRVVRRWQQTGFTAAPIAMVTLAKTLV